ncbi:mannosyl-oligosaccharide alpha-1,2-mannosidase-like protein, partial [Geopyxis carbonaria]
MPSPSAPRPRPSPPPRLNTTQLHGRPPIQQHTYPPSPSPSLALPHHHLLDLTDAEAALLDATDASLSPSHLHAAHFQPRASNSMGSGRTFSRASRPRLRHVLFAALGLASLLYLLQPFSAFSRHSRDGVVREKIQFEFKKNGVEAGDKERAEAVRETMRDTFWTYRKAAWGMDEVRPVSGGNRTSRNGWAATIVDSLTTTAMMGLEEEFMLELNFTLAIDFNHAIDLVDPFETTIRYLGSLVSTVDLIDSGSMGFTVPQTQRDALLRQAQFLADKLAPAFDSPTGMVWPRVNWTTNVGCREHPEGRPYKGYPHATIGPARAGSNWLENMSLSRLTGEAAYGRNATNAWRPLVWNKWVEEWPGLIDGPWDIMTGTPYEVRTRSWDAGHDSYYEYLIKAHILIPSDPHSVKYRTRWLQAVQSTEDNLVYRAQVKAGPGKGHRYLHQWRSGWLLNEMGHLACFAGGNLLLGGRYTATPRAFQLGLDLVDTCHHLYATAGPTKIGPEYVSWLPEGHDGAYEPGSEHQMSQLRDKGYWVADARWMLRPETVESYFYAYRITGEKKYQDWAWDAYQAMVKASKAEFGYAEVQDVTREPGAANRRDKEESFWGAETLKYLWLTMSSEGTGSLDEWVYSTEAHPFRIV